MLQDAVTVVAAALPRDMDELRLHRVAVDVDDDLVVVAELDDEMGQSEVFGR